jgi:hypothetical protein
MTTKTPTTQSDKIRTAYTSLATRPGQMISLRQLRDATGLTGIAFDNALRVLIHTEPHLYLDAEPKQRQLTDADRRAAYTVGGQARHLLGIGQ